MKFNNLKKAKLVGYRKLCDQWKKLNSDLLKVEKELGIKDEGAEAQVNSILYLQYGIGDISLDQLERSLTILENSIVKPAPKKKKVARKIIQTLPSNSVQYLGNV